MESGVNNHYLVLDSRKNYPTMVSGEGCYLTDSEGRRYLDASGGIGLVNVGYGQQTVIEAIKDQSSKLPYCAANLFVNEATVAYAAALAQVTPPPIKHFHFTSGGSESTDLAIKIARQYHLLKGNGERHRIISRNTSYHGATLGALSVSGMPARTEKFTPYLFEVSRVSPPYCYRCPLNKTYPACGLACAQELEAAIIEAGPETVAAFVMEPVIGSAGGGIVAPDGYHDEIRKICDRYGVLLIVDEVLSGFGRTGRMFAVEHTGLKPDLMIMAKGISSGYVPMGAVGVSEEIHNAFAESGTPLDHIFTFGGHPVAAAAALASLKIIVEDRLADKAAQMGQRLMEQGQRWRRHNCVGDVRGLGLLVGIELVTDATTKQPFAPGAAAANRVAAHALEQGLVVYPAGNLVCLYPPLTISEAEVDSMVDMLDAALEAFAKETLV